MMINKPSLSAIVMVVMKVPSITLGSDVVNVTVKVWFPSNALSSSIETSTHLTALSVDPVVKISLDKYLM